MTGQTIALYYWGLSKLGIGPSHIVFRQLDELVSAHHTKFTLQQYGMILYTQISDMRTIPDAVIREALTKFLEATRDEPISLEQIIHFKLLTRVIHKIHKKSPKQA